MSTKTFCDVCGIEAPVQRLKVAIGSTEFMSLDLGTNCNCEGDLKKTLADWKVVKDGEKKSEKPE